MKEQGLGAILKGIIGGTPAEVFVKIIAAIVAALWANLQLIGLAVLAYFLLLVVDACMGAALSMKSGEPFSVRHFTLGPLKKFLITIGMLFATGVLESMLPGNFLFYGVSAFICATALLDVAKKYSAFSNSKLASWIEAKIGAWVKVG